MTSTPGELSTAADALRNPAAAMDPAIGLAVADWLGCLAMLDPSEHGGDTCGWCGSNHALTIARTVSGAAR